MVVVVMVGRLFVGLSGVGKLAGIGTGELKNEATWLGWLTINDLPG